MTELDESTEIVLMRLGAIGEAVSLLPALKLLTEVVPDQNLTLLAENVVARLVKRDFPGINRILADRFYSNRSPFGFLQPDVLTDLLEVYNASRRRRYDLKICFHTIESWTNALKPHFFNLTFSSERSAGFEDSFLPEWTVGVDSRSDHWEPMYEKNIRLIQQLTGKSTDIAPWIGVSSDRQQELKVRLQDDVGINFERKLMVVCPGAADPWRCWPVKKYQQVLREFAGRFDVNMVFIGTERERTTSAEIASVLDEKRTFNLCGATELEELPELIDEADLFLSNDTGPLHLAVARQVPSVGLFGPGLLNPWASYDVDWFRAVYRRDPEDPYLETYKDDPVVLRNISVDRVLEELSELAGKTLDNSDGRT